MSAESRFYQFLHPHMKGHVQRIESSAGPGIPDVVWCYRGVTCWLELKVANERKQVLLRKEQYAWGMRHTSVGGKVWVLALEPALDELWAWKFPLVVVPYGVSHKYVDIAIFPTQRVPIKQAAEILNTILLTT